MSDSDENLSSLLRTAIGLHPLERYLYTFAVIVPGTCLGKEALCSLSRRTHVVPVVRLAGLDSFFIMASGSYCG
jgi:hypothetical protein